MRSPFLLALAVLTIVPAHAGGQAGVDRRPTPISRHDLTRMLRSGTYTRDEIAGMIRRACISFVPSATERELYRGLGADRTILSAIDACLSLPAPQQAQPSGLPPARSEAAATTFASPAPARPAAVTEEEPPAAEGRDVSAQADSAALPTRPPAGEARNRESDVSSEARAPAPDAEAAIEVTVPIPSLETQEDSVPAPREPEPTAVTPTSESQPDLAAPRDEVSRLRLLAAEAAARLDMETAVQIRRDIVSLVPEDPIAWFQLGETLASAGNREEARDAFIRAARLDRARRRIRP